jgi:hypothetical protein
MFGFFIHGKNLEEQRLGAATATRILAQNVADAIARWNFAHAMTIKKAFRAKVARKA